MNRFSRTALAFGLALSLAPLAQAADLPDARTLIDAHIAAAGGREALLRAAQGTSKVQMEIVENGMKLDMTMYARDADRATVMTIPGAGDFRSGYVGGIAWGMDPMNGPRLLQGKERDQAVEQSDSRYSFYDASVIASAKTVGLSESEGRPCYRVEIKWTNGRDSAACFGTADGLMLSNESTVVTAMGEIKQVSHISEYRDFGGAKVSAKAKSKAAGMTQIISLISYDPALPSAEVFALPPAIEALVKKAGANAGAGSEAKSSD
jgi:hypothetical protein